MKAELKKKLELCQYFFSLLVVFYLVLQHYLWQRHITCLDVCY